MRAKKHWIQKIPFFVVVLLIPISIFFYYDYVTLANVKYLCGAVLLRYFPHLLLISVSAYLLIRLVRTLKYIRQFTTIRHVILIFVVIGNTMFFEDISSLREIIYFFDHQDEFSRLAEIGSSSECYLSEAPCLEYIELPEDMQNSLGRERLAISSGWQNRALTFTLRTDIHYVYFENQTNLPKNQRIYQGIYDCFSYLEDSWFLCYILSGN